MRSRRLLLFSLLLVATSVTLATPSSFAATASGACARSGSRTEAANEHVRVYRWRGTFYGCAYQRGRAYRLGVPEFECISSGGCEGISRIRIAGRYVAYDYFVWEDRAPPFLTGWIYVRDLVSGRIRHEHKVGGYLRDAAIGAFRVTPSGAVGYIVKFAPGDSVHRLTEVWRMDRRGRKRLDRSYKIRRDFLHLDDGTLSWIKNGRRQAARLV